MGAQGTVDLSGKVTTFTFTWQRLTPDSSFFGGYRIDTVATGQVYRPSAGSAFALAQSWLIRCVVQTSNAAGSTTALSAPRTLSPAPPLKLLNDTTDIRVAGIEVTQAVQEDSCNTCAGTLPSRTQADDTSPGSANYQGVTLAAGNFTVVRVFATFTQPASLANLAGATATLNVYDSNGHRISTLNPDSSPPLLTRTPLYVSAAERATPGVSFNFLVPWQETLHRALGFRATVKPKVGLGQIAQCASCKANTFDLIGVPVRAHRDRADPSDPTHGRRRPDQHERAAGVRQRADRAPAQGEDLPLRRSASGRRHVDRRRHLRRQRARRRRRAHRQRLPDRRVHRRDLPGLGGSTFSSRHLYDAVGPVSIVRDDRPLTSAMHEIGHGLALVHADTLPHPDGTPDCGGNSNKQVGEAWPPDNEGRIQSIGLDWRNWTIGQAGSLPQTVVEGYDHVGKALSANYFYYDFMSYCLPTDSNVQLEADHWISLRNWNRLVAYHPPAPALPAAARHVRAASTAQMRVVATVDSARRTSIFEVEPGRDHAAAGDRRDPHRIESRDSAGAVIASVAPTTTVLHVDGQDPGLVLGVMLPFTSSTAAVVVSGGGVELARRARSPHAPTVKLLRPGRGAHLSGRTVTLVRWRAHDADGDPLTATVDYSADGGRHWRVVADRLPASSARAPSRLLSASRNGRLRIRVTDGFNAVVTTSGRLRADGAAPLVRIIRTGRGSRVRAGTMLLLKGAAFDDADRPLTGGHLKWYAGRRLLGRGELLTVMSLSPNVKSIRLVATDARHRSSQAVLALKVIAEPPAFLVARAPTHIKATATRVRIVVASTVPAVLMIGGARHRVGRKPRAITIRIRRGHRALRLKYSLRAIGGGTIRGTYVAKR